MAGCQQCQKMARSREYLGWEEGPLAFWLSLCAFLAGHCEKRMLHLVGLLPSTLDSAALLPGRQRRSLSGAPLVLLAELQVGAGPWKSCRAGGAGPIVLGSRFKQGVSPASEGHGEHEVGMMDH